MHAYVCFGETAPFVISEEIMGTTVTQTIYGPHAEKAAREASSRIREIESILSFHLPASDLSRLNNHAGEGDIVLKPETIYNLNKSIYYSGLTNGGFNVLVGPLVKLWKVTSPDADIPSAGQIAALMPLIDYRDLHVNIESGTARLDKKGQMADLGGIAKGYASDEVIAIYKKRGITKAIIDIGGNLGLLGFKSKDTPWCIGIQHPGKDRGNPACAVYLSDCSLSTSGAYERFFKKNGKIYHHIIDPATGYPADTGLLSVSIIAPKSIDSDALSKIFVIGTDKGIALIKRIPDTNAVLITKDKRIIVTDGLKHNFKLIAADDFTVQFK
jgi:thiamine biosynthesis lipoprotein